MRHCPSSWRGFRLVLAAGTLATALGSGAEPAAAQKPRAPVGSPTSAPQLAVPSDECCLLLLYPIGARRASMSEAVTSVASPDAVFYNPAGLGEIERNHLVLHHVADEAQQIDAFTLLLSPWNLATFGLSYELADFGDQEFRNPDGVETGRITFREHILIASFATSVAAGVSAGMNYKFFNRRHGCSGQCEGFPNLSSVTHGLDFGVQYRPYWLGPLRVGAALLNVGVPLQVINSRQADPMPTRLRVGVSYDVMHHIDSAGPYSLLLLVDAEENEWQRPTTPVASFAMELAVDDAVFLRGGYGGGEGVAAGPAVGVAVVYSSFNIGIAKRVSSGPLGDPFQLTIDVGF